IPPSVEDKHLIGTEDNYLSVSWEDFGVSEDTEQIKVVEILGGGSLQVMQEGEWVKVNRNDILTESSQLRFVPEKNESSVDGYGDLVGNNEADYAQIHFVASDAAGNRNGGRLTIDITPVADAPKVEVNVTSGASQPGTDGEIIKVNGGSGEHGGFDIQNGKIVAIGTGVRVWGTVDKDGRNPSGKPIDQLSGIKIPDGVDAGSVLIPYNQTNANSNAPNVTDIFILNEYSG